MPVAVSYPGVYIQEVPSGVHTITGVATSIAAFVDFFPAGPMDQATEIFSFADFQRQFGGLDNRSEASYAIQQFFLNGGQQAYVIRVSSGTSGKGAVAAQIGMEDQIGAAGTSVLIATAKSSGAVGNNIRLDVDYGATDPSAQFNLTITQVATTNGTTTIVATEVFRNLVVDPSKSNDAVAVVNAGSQLITLSEPTGSTGKRPAQTGTASKAIKDVGALGLSAGDQLDVALGKSSKGAIKLPDSLPATAGLADLATQLQSLLRGLLDNNQKPTLPNATVNVVGSISTQGYLVVKSGTSAAADDLALTDSGSGLANKLGFGTSTQNVQQYALGATAVDAQVLPGSKQVSGDDGTWDPSSDPTGMALGLIGDPVQKTGMYALLDVDLFNILCIPATMNLPDQQAAQVATTAVSLCEQRRAMYVLDVPQRAATRDTVPAMMSWLDANAELRSRNAALYFPRLDVADPTNGFRLRPVSPSGTLAGLWARIDGTRGVWKAPAGTEASLSGVQKLEYKLTDPENGVLNPLAINCLRNFPIYGPVSWGARTLYGSDQQADDYKYIPVRRLALFIEESLFRGTQWAVFEPNDTPLWAQLRLNVEAFMQTLFRQGAFQGSTPQAAYFVQCDDKTNPQASIDLGIVNIIVGFAPLKPAEFVVIQIQQLAGQLAS